MAIRSIQSCGALISSIDGRLAWGLARGLRSLLSQRVGRHNRRRRKQPWKDCHSITGWEGLERLIEVSLEVFDAFKPDRQSDHVFRQPASFHVFR